MRKNTRPGPLSSKSKVSASKSKRHSPNLGDTGTDVRDSTCTSSEFHSPDRDEAATDYGLEFTTSRLRNSGRYSSTPRTRRPSSGRKRGGQQTPSSPTRRGRSGASISAPVRKEVPVPQPQPRRRKQRNPRRKLQRFIREVNQLNKRTTPLIPLLPFSRLVRELLFDHSKQVNRMTPESIQVLQEATEMYVTQRLQDAYMLTLHRDRVTLMVKDLQLIQFIRSNGSW